MFPFIKREGLTDLCASIRKIGQQLPIVIYEDKILDGRARRMACDIVGVEPIWTEYKGSDPIAYVTAANLARRHLPRTRCDAIADRLDEL